MANRRGAPRGIRVVAGSARGRRLVVPTGDAVRPTKDFVREAVFNALDARGRIVDAVVLDLFAGTGALAIEALSRGAASATLVERDPAALDAIARNLDALGFAPRARVVRGDAHTVLRGTVPPAAPFDLVLVDPPYGTTDEEVGEIVAALAAPGWLDPDALVAVERGTGHPPSPPAGFRTTWERAFGDTLVSFVEPD